MIDFIYTLLFEMMLIIGGLLLALLVIKAARLLARAIEAAKELTKAERAIARTAASLLLAIDFTKALLLLWQAGGPA